MTPSPKSITQLLIEWRDGDEQALEQLIPMVHQELRRMAHRYLRRERPGHSFQSADLVNEAYIRLVDQKGLRWQSRAHFYGVAAQAMRRILVDHARARATLKRGGGENVVVLEDIPIKLQTQAADLIALDKALTDLAAIDPRKGKLVEMRYFGGMSIEETAEALEVSPGTVMREWGIAKAWLLRTLSSGAQA